MSKRKKPKPIYDHQLAYLQMIMLINAEIGSELIRMHNEKH